ncbi:hypothetical protein D9756_005054 [Leucocoprinus leucothites]|uniref:Rad4-domain-containing protein n=1 Tax=Leucocoprinus leucothites TaxID=201217 RepID=A0A8H5G8Z8_9AGAR|nr:hypothetical protein D9756_005054 [Leucoagaricus leucothites]
MDTNLIPPAADSDDEYDWEEVETQDVQPQTIEITLNAQPKAEEAKKRSGISHAERILRIDCHKIHTVALLVNARIRNRWLNDGLLHARLLSLCPLKLQNAFAMIHKSRVPDSNQRGRMFENAVHDLTDWWSSSFEVVPEGHLRNRTFHDVQKLLERYRLLSNDDDSHNSEMDLDILQDALDEDGEYIRSPKSLMKHALMARGSRDTSGQLFTALCRALAIPARLVVSLQSVPWQASIGKPKPKYTKKKAPGKSKGKGKATSTGNSSQASEHEESAGDNDMEEVEIPAASSSTHDVKGKSKAISFPGVGQRLDSSPPVGKGKEKEKAKPPIKLRKARPQGRRLGSASPSTSDAGDVPPDPTTTPPVFWTEVFSKPDGRWLPVDPIRSIVNKRKVFDPTPIANNVTTNAAVAQFSRFNSPVPKKPSKAPLKQDNRLLYVLAFEEDGYARDVTRRYAREYGSKVAKVQGGSGAANMGGGDLIVSDDIEDEELETAQMLEGMPTTISGFKDHPIYVLLRHLKQNETIHPPPPSTPELGKFRGEPVYPRSAVVSLKTAENWMRSEGRTVKAGEQPLKMIKVRAGTVNKLRELEVIKEAGASGEGGPPGDVMQGLYARSQTEVYVPDPVIDGIVPKNNFGNIDLYTPSMLPRGGVHIPYKGVAKIARKLGFDFAEAVTGFEFKKRRAFPVIEGVVIAKENEGVLLEAFWESERVAEEKARAKREERVIKQWTRLIQGLRIRQRLQEQYGTKPDRFVHEDDAIHKGKGKMKQEKGDGSVDEDEKDFGAVTDAGKDGLLQTETEEMPGDDGDGGFLIGADDVVEAFHLPKFQYVPDQPVLSFQPEHPSASSSENQHPKITMDKKLELEEDSTSDAPDFMTYDLDEDEGMEIDNPDVSAELSTSNGISGTPDNAFVPKTMAELAADAMARQQARHGSLSSRPFPIGQEHQQRAGQSGFTGDEIVDGGINENVNTINGPAKKAGTDADVNAPGQSTSDVAEVVPPTIVPDTQGSTRKLRSNARAKHSPRKKTPMSIPQRRRNTRTTGRKRARKDQSDMEDPEVSVREDDADDADDYGGGAERSKGLAKRKKSRITETSTVLAANGPPISTPSNEGRDFRSIAAPTRTLRPRTSKNRYQD